jgi:hypothetical protein
MNFDDVYLKSLKYFPNVKIKFKNESMFMKALSILLFFNKDFDKYITTIGETIYFPSKEQLYKNQDSSIQVYLHELVHVNDYYNDKLFKIKYLLPQILFIPFLLTLLISWKISLLGLLFLLPLPAYFRAQYELKAYVAQLYVKSKMNKNIDYYNEANKIYSHFDSSDYYYMYPFKSIRAKILAYAFLIKNKKMDFELKSKFDDILK